ncbi:unnamed protein product, partial [Notodromas monacha]
MHKTKMERLLVAQLLNQVKLGEHNRQITDEFEVEIKVNGIFEHEDYNSFTFENDIAILQLETPANLTERIGLLQLPEFGKTFEGKKDLMCNITGWGTTQEGGSLARVLVKAEVPIVTRMDCEDAYGWTNIYDGMLCAGYYALGGVDACQKSMWEFASPQEILWKFPGPPAQKRLGNTALDGMQQKLSETPRISCCLTAAGKREAREIWCSDLRVIVHDVAAQDLLSVDQPNSEGKDGLQQQQQQLKTAGKAPHLSSGEQNSAR